MANANMDVRPGDLITSDLWQSLLTRLTDLETQVQQLSGSVSTGTVTVPDVFGRTLKDARGVITQPSTQLAIGFIIDSFGHQIDDSLQASDNLIVIGQMPQAGTRTHPFTSVNLAVSGISNGTPPVSLKPKINPGGFSPVPVPAGTELTIGGENFAPIPSDNVVTMDGMAVVVSESSTPTFLKVSVPKNLPKGPNSTGQPTNNAVQVHVTTPKGEDTATCSVSAPLSNEPSPHIDTITPDPAKFTQPMIINGSGFSATAADNKVTFTGKPTGGVTPTAATTNQLTVTLPESLKSEFDTVPKTISFDVVVRTKEVASNTKPQNIRRLV